MGAAVARDDESKLIIRQGSDTFDFHDLLSIQSSWLCCGDMATHRLMKGHERTSAYGSIKNITIIFASIIPADAEI